MGCCNCFTRKGLWLCWAFNAVLVSIHSIIAVSHGAVLDKLIVNNKAANAILDAMIAGITCTVFLNVGYLIITALILLRKTIALNGAGANYGFQVGLSFMMFFQMVQVGFCLQSLLPWIDEFIVPNAGSLWKSDDDATHKALVAFSYLCAVSYLALTVVFVCGSGALMNKNNALRVEPPGAIQLEENSNNAQDNAVATGNDNNNNNSFRY